MKKLYNKVSPVVAKIGLFGLILSLVVLVGASLYSNSLEATEAWAIYYASWAKLIATWALIAFAVLYVIFDIVNLWHKYIRKAIVSLKRSPSTIPLLMMFVTFLFYSLNLTDVSDTTAKIYGKGMGLCQFCIMLFSLLSLVCMLNAFPRRKKANIPMIILMFAMFGIIIYCDIHYCNMILNALYRTENPIVVTKDTQYIRDAYNMLNIHKVMLIVSAALIVLLPVYSKLLRMINTSVAVEDNGEMAQIEIQD